MDDADAVLRQTLNALNSEPPDMAVALWNSMALLPLARGQHQDAETIAARTLERRMKLFGPRHPQTARSADTIGCISMAKNRPQDAEPRFREAVSAAENSLSAGHWLLARFRSDLGDCLARLERLDDAERELKTARAALITALGPGHPLTRTAGERLVCVYEANGQAASAAALRAEMAVRDQPLPSDKP